MDPGLNDKVSRSQQLLLMATAVEVEIIARKSRRIFVVAVVGVTL